MHQQHTSPIHKLPDDILVMIFLYFPPTPASELEDDYMWMHITHVCRRWRSVSLGCSLLWTTIKFKPPAWVPVFLERARGAPLNVKVDWGRDGSRHNIDDAVTSALGHLHHTRYLMLLELPSGFANRAIAIFKEHAVDMLEMLHLSNVDKETKMPLTQSPIELPDGLFAGPPSQLRRLTIRGLFTLTWRNQLFSAPLTNLYLDVIKAVSLPTLLEYLRTCTLEVLTLIFQFPQAVLPPLPENYLPVEIPTLQHLRIGGDSVSVADLVRRLRLPASCSINLANRHLWGNITTVAMTEALATELDSLPATMLYDYLQITQPYEIIGYVIWSLSPLERSNSLLPYPFQLTLQPQPGPRTMDEIRRDIDAFTAVFSRITPLHRLKSLRRLSISMRSTSLITLDTWLAALHELQCLETLRLEGQCCYDFATAFALLAEDHDMLPRLNELEILHAHLSYSVGVYGLAKQLCRALLLRRGVGCPALRLEFKYCHVSPDQLQKLEQSSGQAVEISGDPDTWGVGEDEVEEEEDDEDEEEAGVD